MVTFAQILKLQQHFFGLIPSVSEQPQETILLSSMKIENSRERLQDKTHKKTRTLGLALQGYLGLASAGYSINDLMDIFEVSALRDLSRSDTAKLLRMARKIPNSGKFQNALSVHLKNRKIKRKQEKQSVLPACVSIFQDPLIPWQSELPTEPMWEELALFSGAIA